MTKVKYISLWVKEGVFLNNDDINFFVEARKGSPGTEEVVMDGSLVRMRRVDYFKLPEQMEKWEAEEWIQEQPEMLQRRMDVNREEIKERRSD